MIDCALANLIALSKVVSAEIFAFSRAVEDAVDLALMRSRAKSKAAQALMEARTNFSSWQTHGKQAGLEHQWLVQWLCQRWSALALLLEISTAQEEAQLHARVSCAMSALLPALHELTGSALPKPQVRADYIELPPAVHALPGVNGSRKSTFFCMLIHELQLTSEKAAALPSGIAPLTPSDHFEEEKPDSPDDLCIAADESCEVVHNDANDSDEIVPKAPTAAPSPSGVKISQSFCWLLHTRPIDWIYQCHLLEEKEDAEPCLHIFSTWWMRAL